MSQSFCEDVCRVLGAWDVNHIQFLVSNRVTEPVEPYQKMLNFCEVCGPLCEALTSLAIHVYDNWVFDWEVNLAHKLRDPSLGLSDVHGRNVFSLCGQ